MNLETTFTSADKKLYHTNAHDIEAKVDDKFYFGFQPKCYLIPQGPEKSLRFKTIVDFSLEMIDTGSSSRYEFSSLSSLNTLSGSDVFDGLKPDLKPGKISIFYQVMFLPNAPKRLSEFNKNLKGFLLYPFDFTDFPSMFLENQTGSAQYTDRIECVKRRGKKSIV